MWYKVETKIHPQRASQQCSLPFLYIPLNIGTRLNRAIPEKKEKKRDLYVLFPYLIMVTVPSKNLSSLILYLQKPELFIVRFGFLNKLYFIGCRNEYGSPEEKLRHLSRLGEKALEPTRCGNKSPAYDFFGGLLQALGTRV
jgi:hypothetical protein